MEVGHMRWIKAVCMSESLTIAMKGNEQSWIFCCIIKIRVIALLGIRKLHVHEWCLVPQAPDTVCVCGWEESCTSCKAGCLFPSLHVPHWLVIVTLSVSETLHSLPLCLQRLVPPTVIQKRLQLVPTLVFYRWFLLLFLLLFFLSWLPSPLVRFFFLTSIFISWAFLLFLFCPTLILIKTFKYIKFSRNFSRKTFFFAIEYNKFNYLDKMYSRAIL